ncbi:hypothetical protein U9M48_004694 [Paspalum notatum var. saurae]|uniref:Uncharacterized protein n=1 Tax=Paspalum notatum var. saurae TaxID=547442 RepID=A0AAQ3PN63_PASNO
MRRQNPSLPAADAPAPTRCDVARRSAAASPFAVSFARHPTLARAVVVTWLHYPYCYTISHGFSLLPTAD